MKPMIMAGVLMLAALAAPAGAQSGPPQAKSGFSIVYDIRAKGIVAGKFSYAVTRAGDAYHAVADRRMTGLVRVAVGAKQDYHYDARGTVGAGGVRPLTYEHVGGKRGRRVQARFVPGDIVTTATPPMGMGAPPASREQKAGALDQLSSIYEMALSQGDPCARTLRIYLDGRSRFDLVMRPNGAEKVSTPAFKGLARRCSVSFRPIAGFSDPQKPAALTFLLAPVGGIYAPIRIAMPTDDAGIVILEATSFTLGGP
jgi:hypothetical protein